MDKYIGVLLSSCSGDVLGSQTEGMTRKQIKEHFSLLKMPEDKLYTDDSEMMLVLARHIVKNKTIDFVKIHVEYANEIKNKGYSLKTRTILSNIKKNTTGCFDTPGFSDTNGCVMRIAPLGLLNIDSKTLMQSIYLSTYFTHGGNKDSVFCCFIHCKLINALVNRKFQNFVDYFNYIYAKFFNHKYFAKINIVKFCLNHKINSITFELLGDPNAFQIKAIDAICCAYYIFFKNYQNPKNAIIEAAMMGGDTDTIAKLVGDLCGAYYGYEWLPSEWLGVEGEKEFTELGKSIYEINYMK